MGSGSDLGCCANVTRGLLVVVNILFGALGIVVFAVGIWAIVEDMNYSFVTGNNIASGAALLIVAGIITMVICFLGIIGAIFKLRPLLIIYAALVLIIVVLEIVAGIVAFAFSDSVADEVTERSLEAIRLYTASPDDPDFREDVNDFVEFIQDTFDCCGVNNATDWYIENPNAVAANFVFPACAACNAATDDNCVRFINDTLGFNINATTRGCGDASSDRLTVFFYAVGGLGIAIGILEILGILFALFLCCCITSARKQEVV